MTPKATDDEADDLSPAEAARARRRDHDAAAPARSGMRTGLAKQFKQVLDTQAKRGRAAGVEDEEPPSASRRPASSRGQREKRGQARGDEHAER